MINTVEKLKNLKWLIIILVTGIVICTGVTIWALFFRGGDDISPDYPPQGIESNQTPIDGDDSGKLDTPEGGGAINVTYGTAATVDLSEKTVTIITPTPTHPIRMFPY